jgi:RNA polymerase sigma-70 factor, ECF subfamily
MTTHEIELKALMLASLDGDAASHRALLERLSRRLRAYYKGKLQETNGWNAFSPSRSSQ